MKITNYPREERMFKDIGFAKIYFSFRADYSVNKRHHFGALWNLDEGIMDPESKGFGMHPHKDMEVVTLLLNGEGHHKDNLGNIGTLKAKGVQLITAGTGIMHEEYNYSKTEQYIGYQMFLHPREKGLKPSYQKVELFAVDYLNKLCLIVTPNGSNNTLEIANDSFLNYGIFDQGENLNYKLYMPTNGVLIKVHKGEIEIEGNLLREKDEIGIEDFKCITIKMIKQSEIMIFEVPMENYAI